jgi:hypothetical protein
VSDAFPIVRRSSIFSCARCAASRNVCNGVFPKQYLPECSRCSLYSRTQLSRSSCNCPRRGMKFLRISQAESKRAYRKVHRGSTLVGAGLRSRPRHGLFKE